MDGKEWQGKNVVVYYSDSPTSDHVSPKHGTIKNFDNNGVTLLTNNNTVIFIPNSRIIRIEVQEALK